MVVTVVVVVVAVTFKRKELDFHNIGSLRKRE